ncbi:hypothetical protein [Actinomadura rudentiformis]|uniref:TetR/AcrR family transcriptional regulator n=1 Tax=Actinomadura rudentiformis TaxID=359158 RepID=A0A6H9YUT7_9ACTN|nr:hypothetical protein [Actinomadura rudentiformis]KAB2348335.1 hypothetical protein F8566_16160 [Actinomadura rudentiformis]
MTSDGGDCQGKIHQDLPFPYNQDMSSVITHLDRRSPSSRHRLANDPVTSAYLVAAIRLASRHLGPDSERTPTDPEDENSITRPLLSFLSQRAVVAEVANNPPPFPKQGTVGAMRDRWKSQSDFLADLIQFVLWHGHHAADYSRKMAAGAEDLFAGPDFVSAVHSLAYLNMRDAINLPGSRLRYAAMITAEGDKVITEGIRGGYATFLEPWKEIYRAMARARGLQLRPGVEIDDFANLLAAIVDGLTLRSIANPSNDLVDHKQKQTLLGVGALALLYSIFERMDEADGMSLEEAVNARIYGAN